MIESLIAIIFILIAAIFLALGIVVYKLIIKVEKKEKQTHIKVAIKKASTYDASLKVLLYNLKSSVNATKIIVARFHNGGNFANGYEMKKFSVTHETPGGTCVPLMDKQVAVLNSRYSEAILCLVSTEGYFISDVDDCLDLTFKHDMKEYGFKATYLFLIKQLDGTEEGFIGVDFNHTHVMSKEDRDKVREQLANVLSVLNMTEYTTQHE